MESRDSMGEGVEGVADLGPRPAEGTPARPVAGSGGNPSPEKHRWKAEGTRPVPPPLLDPALPAALGAPVGHAAVARAGRVSDRAATPDREAGAAHVVSRLLSLPRSRGSTRRGGGRHSTNDIHRHITMGFAVAGRKSKGCAMRAVEEAPSPKMEERRRWESDKPKKKKKTRQQKLNDHAS